MSGGAPAAPDYQGAANQQYQANIWNTNQQTAQNRISQYNPWGSVTYGPSGEQTVSLNGNLQSALDAQQGLQADRSQLAGGMMDQVGANLKSPMDWGSFSPYTDANA